MLTTGLASMATATAVDWIEAAHALWRLTGETTDSLPVLLRTLDHLRAVRDYGSPMVVTTAEYLGQIGPAAAGVQLGRALPQHPDDSPGPDLPAILRPVAGHASSRIVRDGRVGPKTR